MNPVTQAIGAAHAIAARAVAVGVRRQSVVELASAPDAPHSALDAPLDELTGDELLTLALAAEVLAARARTLEAHRRNTAVSAEIEKLKRKKV